MRGKRRLNPEPWRLLRTMTSNAISTTTVGSTWRYRPKRATVCASNHAVISAISFQDSDDLIKRANATTFGLGSGVWTTNVSKAHRVAKALRAGSVWVNCYQAMDPAVPFGGYKMSGYGRESGKQHVEEYLNVKAVWVKTG